MSIASTGLGHDETPRGRGRPRRTALQRRTYTIEEAGELLGLSRNRAFVAARADALPVPVIRIGHRMFVSQVALDRLLGDDAA